MTTTRPSPTVTAGTRIHWAGDFANDPRTGTVTKIDGCMMHVQWDGAVAAILMPVMLMSSPRWSVVG